VTLRWRGRPRQPALYSGVRYSAPPRRLWSAAQPFVETQKKGSHGCQREGKNKRLDHLYLANKLTVGKQDVGTAVAFGWHQGLSADLSLGRSVVLWTTCPLRELSHHSEISSPGALTRKKCLGLEPRLDMAITGTNTSETVSPRRHSGGFNSGDG